VELKGRMVLLPILKSGWLGMSKSEVKQALVRVQQQERVASHSEINPSRDLNARAVLFSFFHVVSASIDRFSYNHLR